MYRQLLCTAPGVLTWRDYDEPALAPDQVRVVVEYAAAKHGTEMAFYRGYAFQRGPWNPELQLHEATEGPLEARYPFHVGNMYAGPVVAVGTAVTALTVGDRVVGSGGFAETHTARASDLLALPESMSWQSAMCYDPAQFALGAVRDGQVRVGDRVAVFGLGAIGLCTVQLARLAGAAEIIALDPIAARRDLALRLGATSGVDSSACDAGRRIKERCAGVGADVVIDFSGHRLALQAALRGVAFGGTVVCGAYPPPLDGGLDLGAEAHMNIPNLVFSRACSQPDRDHPRWSWERIKATVWRYLAEGRISGEGIVDPVCTFDQLDTAYHEMAAHPERTVKLGVSHPNALELIAAATQTAVSR